MVSELLYSLLLNPGSSPDLLLCDINLPDLSDPFLLPRRPARSFAAVGFLCGRTLLKKSKKVSRFFISVVPNKLES